MTGEAQPQSRNNMPENVETGNIVATFWRNEKRNVKRKVQFILTDLMNEHKWFQQNSPTLEEADKPKAES